MAGNNKEDFAEILNALQEPSSAHPFGQTVASPGVQRNKRSGPPIRQQTRMFMCPDELSDYDDVCNRAWSGEIQIRYEKSYETKTGEHVIVLCWFENRSPTKPDELESSSSVEPLETSGPLS